jgi:chromosome segregation ATPase
MDGSASSTSTSTERRPRRTMSDEIVRLKSELLAAGEKAANELAALQKKLDTAEAQSKRYQDDAKKAEAELEQVTEFIDALEGAPPREKEVPGRYGMQTVTLKPITRLAAYLVQRKQP